MKSFRLKKFLTLISAVTLLFLIFVAGGVIDRMSGISFLDKFISSNKNIVVKESVGGYTGVSEVVKKVGPATVTVSATTPRRKVLQFSPFGGFSQKMQGGDPQDIGSGFIVSRDGLVITNKHVVADTNLSYKVATSDGKTYDAKQISRDPNNDIAIIKIDAKNLPTVELGDSSKLEVGDFVIAIGTALGEFRNTVTTGVVSGLGRGISTGGFYEGYVERLDNVIQTDAAINPGNSGGPLLNSYGEVIGINVAVAAGAENIGFSIPINILKAELDQFKATGKFPSKAYLGVEYQSISKQIALLNNVPEGSLIVSVRDDSPAKSADIREGDIVFKIDGKSLDSQSGGLGKTVDSKKPGDSIELEIWRDGETLKKTVKLGEFAE